MTILKAFLFLCILAKAGGESLCDLCADEEGDAFPRWPDAVLKVDGTTCGSMAINLAQLVPGSTTCTQLQAKWRNQCCGANKPVDAMVAPTPAPVVSGVVVGDGPYSVCNMCPSGGVPTSESMILNFIYLWEDTCIEYYKDGLNGNIPDHMCSPLQFFAEDPCGCVPNAAPPADDPTPDKALIPTQKPFNMDADKDSLKMSNNMGGAGGGFRVRGRGLKGQS